MCSKSGVEPLVIGAKCDMCDKTKMAENSWCLEAGILLSKDPQWEMSSEENVEEIEVMTTMRQKTKSGEVFLYAPRSRYIKDFLPELEFFHLLLELEAFWQGWIKHVNEWAWIDDYQR